MPAHLARAVRDDAKGSGRGRGFATASEKKQDTRASARTALTTPVFVRSSRSQEWQSTNDTSPFNSARDFQLELSGTLRNASDLNTPT